MRIACVHVPDLALAATLRAEPRLLSQPLAVVQAKSLDGRAHVLSCTPAAEDVEVGRTLAEARAICPALLVRRASPERIRATAQAVAQAAAPLSPRIEEAAPGLVYLDAEGLTALVGEDEDVARALVRACERAGIAAAVGVAEGRVAAYLAARAALPEIALEETRAGVGGGAFRVVARAEQARFLASLPLLALATSEAGDDAAAAHISDELLQALQRFGLRTLGDVARLPVGPLAARLGPEAARLHRLARGEDLSALVPAPPPLRFEEGDELEWDAASIEPLLFVWKSLLDRIAARLSARGLMAAELSLLLRLADGSWDERAISLAAPTREVPPLLQLLRLAVEERPPTAAVRAVRLSVEPVREQLEQLSLFGPRTASRTQLAAAVAKIAALVGPERAGTPVAVDTHRPFTAAVAPFLPPLQKDTTRPSLPKAHLTANPTPTTTTTPNATSTQHSLPLAARALRPPRTAEVRCDEAGRPLLVIGEGALGGRVVECAGPYRTVAEWWTEETVALDSYDLELSGGLLVRASRELASGAWRIEAIYD